LPPGFDASVVSADGARAAVIERDYASLEGNAVPEPLFGCENSIAPTLLEDSGIEVRALLPAGAAFDFAVNTLTYPPGAALPMVELHIMEHGLLMLAGGGIYRLGESWYPVTAGDFIWMAPYCPQWFGALGKTPARYLLYKDWNRHPLP
jgi:(S)-ureidoglycine aminohydrolase